ncbi:unnamed protein product [Mesocestoides corti]|uniref:Protein yippee-like n=2 Tax=Mesocestoides corti TaxID=53468 RepID=A0A0R3UNZ6_MESCO|nr:unnamed protein product [Mesocestoides corti]
MGILFIEHLGGRIVVECKCHTPLTNADELISANFQGATGSAMLFRKVVNIFFSALEPRKMTTGWHRVRDVFCVTCHTRLGWAYEFAEESDQQYKEGKVILEKALINSFRGVPDYEDGDDEQSDVPDSPSERFTFV